MNNIILKPGREKSLLRRHPWLFSGAVKSVENQPGPGETVNLVSSSGQWLAYAAWSPASQIVARVWSFRKEDAIEAEFFGHRVRQAAEFRQALHFTDVNGWRVINAESDGLPGLTVDYYAGFAVCQFLAAGVERWKPELVRALEQALPCRGIWERSDAGVRASEKLPPVSGPLAGELPPELIEIQENSLRFLVDVRHGHKTGFYLDQRANRAALAETAAGRRVLNCFAYTGGFGVAAGANGAEQVVNIDSSRPALDLGERNFGLNRIVPAKLENYAGDAFQLLRRFGEEGRRFDAVVLDPPKFVESQGDLERACRGYKDINRLGLQLLNPGGRLFTFSCSGLLPEPLFQKIVADAVLDAGREAKILRRLAQAPDHYTATEFPEGFYLKGLELIVG